MAEIRKLIRSAVFAGRFWPVSAAQATWAPLQKLVARTIGCLNKHLAQNMKCRQLGLSENSVPLHPIVNDHYPY